MSPPLPRVANELSLTVATLRATLSLHELPAPVHDELFSILSSQTEWCSHLTSHAEQRCSSPSSDLSVLSSGGSVTPVASPARYSSANVTPSSVRSEPPAPEGTAEHARWKGQILLRLRRYLGRRLAAEQGKLMSAREAADAAELTSSMLEADLLKVDTALAELAAMGESDAPSSPSPNGEYAPASPVAVEREAVRAPKPSTPDAHAAPHDDATCQGPAPKCASVLTGSSLPTPRMLELDEGSTPRSLDIDQGDGAEPGAPPATSTPTPAAADEFIAAGATTPGAASSAHVHDPLVMITSHSPDCHSPNLMMTASHSPNLMMMTPGVTLSSAPADVLTPQMALWSTERLMRVVASGPIGGAAWESPEQALTPRVDEVREPTTAAGAQEANAKSAGDMAADATAADEAPRATDPAAAKARAPDDHAAMTPEKEEAQPVARPAAREAAGSREDYTRAAAPPTPPLFAPPAPETFAPPVESFTPVESAPSSPRPRSRGSSTPATASRDELAKQLISCDRLETELLARLERLRAAEANLRGGGAASGGGGGGAPAARSAPTAPSTPSSRDGASAASSPAPPSTAHGSSGVSSQQSTSMEASPRMASPPPAATASRAVCAPAYREQRGDGEVASTWAAPSHGPSVAIASDAITDATTDAEPQPQPPAAPANPLPQPGVLPDVDAQLAKLASLIGGFPSRLAEADPTSGAPSAVHVHTPSITGVQPLRASPLSAPEPPPPPARSMPPAVLQPVPPPVPPPVPVSRGEAVAVSYAQANVTAAPSPDRLEMIAAALPRRARAPGVLLNAASPLREAVGASHARDTDSAVSMEASDPSSSQPLPVAPLVAPVAASAAPSVASPPKDSAAGRAPQPRRRRLFSPPSAEQPSAATPPPSAPPPAPPAVPPLAARLNSAMAEAALPRPAAQPMRAVHSMPVLHARRGAVPRPLGHSSPGNKFGLDKSISLQTIGRGRGRE